MAIYIEPIAVDNAQTFTFDRYVSNLTDNDINRMQESAKHAYDMYSNTNSNITHMVQQHVETYSVDDALVRAKRVMETIEEVQTTNEISYLDETKIPTANSTMRSFITSHPEVAKRIKNKTLTPFSNTVPKEPLPNLRYKEATSGINTSSTKKLVVTTTTKSSLKLKDKLTLNKMYRTLIKNIDNIDFE